MNAIARSFLNFIFFLVATYLAVLGVLATIVILAGCSDSFRAPPPPPEPICRVIPTIINRKGKDWSDTLTLPSKGKFAVESHLATTDDTFGDRKFPNTKIEGIEKHLARSCEALGLKDCKKVYSASYMREWTPPEGGLAGQGSVGNMKPSVEQEMWTANFMWALFPRPEPGEKWLVGANEKFIVVSVGFETGPGSQKFLGGLQREGHHYLGTDDASQIEVFGKLKNQNMPYGPINCDWLAQ